MNEKQFTNREPQTRQLDSGLIISKYTVQGSEYYTGSFNGELIFTIKQCDWQWVARNTNDETVSKSKYRNDVFCDLNKIIKEEYG